jgi:hypothetical protein
VHNRGREANLILGREGTAHRPLIRAINGLPPAFTFTITDLVGLTHLKRATIRVILNRLVVMRHLRQPHVFPDKALGWRKSRKEWTSATEAIASYELFIKVFPASARLAAANRVAEAIESDQ